MRFKFLMILLTALQAIACESTSKNLSSKTLHVGFNGLNKFYTKQLFEDAKSIESSWLKNALTPTELIQIINQVDFKKQFVLVYSFGERPNASGKIIMQNIKHRSDVNSKTSVIDTIIEIGVVDKEKCNIFLNIQSYPFIIELVQRPKNGFKLINGSEQNYNFPDDGCKTPISGKPTAE